MAAVKRANGMTMGAVLAYLQREADLDGLVTVSCVEIGEAIGVASNNVSLHLRSLTDAGWITPAGRVKGVKGHAILGYQLSDEAMDA